MPCSNQKKLLLAKIAIIYCRLPSSLHYLMSIEATSHQTNHPSSSRALKCCIHSRWLPVVYEGERYSSFIHFLKYNRVVRVSFFVSCALATSASSISVLILVHYQLNLILICFQSTRSLDGSTARDDARYPKKFHGTDKSLWKWRMRYPLDYKGL